MKRLISLVAILALGFYVGWPAYSAYSIQSALTGGNPNVLAQKIDFQTVQAGLRPAAEARVTAELGKFAGGASPGLQAMITPLVPKVTEQVLQALVTPANAIKVAQGTGSLSNRVGTLVQEQVKLAGGAAGGLGQLIGGATGNGERTGGGAIGGVLSGLAGAGADDRVRGAVGGLLGGGNREPAPQPQAQQQQAEKPMTPAADAREPDGETPSYGLANLKSFAFTGPLSFEIGVAQDPAAAVADFTAEMGFRDFDWKLISVKPNI